MKYKVYNTIKYDNIEKQIFKNRGLENIEEWINADLKNISSWKLLENIDKAVYRVEQAIRSNEKICVVVDCDVDGYTSAAIFINFIYSMYPEYVLENIKYIHHTGKQHGLMDVIDKIKDFNLIICPDSASNDYEQHKELNKLNIDIIILDHHEAPHYSEESNVITVNNQLCDYPNKDFSGAGIVWQFCNAYNEIAAKNGECSFDLCALGL